MNCLVLLVVTVITVSCECSAPIYSPRYSNVYYQRTVRGAPGSNVEFNLPAETKKETETPTEILYKETEATTVRICGQVNPTPNPSNSYEITTEPESEHVTFNTKKSQNLELTEEVDQSISKEPLQPAHIADTVEQGIYYIYHPNGLLQKVVYAATNDQNSMEYVAQLRYENVEPIVEPVYTYDPRTFVLQRLQILN